MNNQKAPSAPGDSWIEPTSNPHGTSTKETLTTGNVAKLGEKILLNNVYLTPLEVVSDDRCPSDVQCVTAGTIKVKTKIEYFGDVTNSKTMTETLELGKTFYPSATYISLIKVTPQPNSKTTIQKTDYKFEFIVGTRNR